jgi:uncharacterized protein
MSNDKLADLVEILKNMQSAVLAFSGGVDSTFLLKALQISGIKTLAVTAFSEIIPSNDLLDAKKMAEEFGMEHRFIKTVELLMEEFVNNSPERCFFCRDVLFQQLTHISSTENYRFILDGSNIDDTEDYRPGRKAAMKYKVRSPLIETGFSKNEIREVSRELGLSTWDKPSSPCLATRIPYGRRITKEVLKRIEKAEDFLRSLGFSEIRIRDHGSVARIEIGKDEFDLMLSREKRMNISETLKSFGYQFISLDLEGYKSGRMNRTLKEE